MVHIVPMDWTSWTAGQSVTVLVYSNADSVELFLNGTSQGSKTMTATTAHLQWSVPFATGTLQAKATKGGTVVATDTVQTAGAAAKLALKADRASITADGRDLSYVEVDIVDAQGVVVPQGQEHDRLHDQRSGHPGGPRRRRLDQPRLLQGHVARRLQRQADGHRSVHDDARHGHGERDLRQSSRPARPASRRKPREWQWVRTG